MINLFLDSTRSPYQDLIELKRLLSSELISQAEIIDIGEHSSTDFLPRLIATIPLGSIEDAQQISDALKQMNSTDLHVFIGPDITPLFADQEENEIISDHEFYGCTKSDLKANDIAINDLSAELVDIIKAKPSGIAFLETEYKGDLEVAYQALLKFLHPIVPMVDKGNALDVVVIERYRNQKPEHVCAQAWTKVLDHIVLEVRYFRYCTEWFGDIGHLRKALSDQQLFNFNFIEFVNNKYLKVDKNQSVDLEMDIIMGTAIRAIGSSSGPVSGAIASAIWTVVRAEFSGRNAEIKAPISKMKSALVKKFLDSIHILENTDKKLSDDWGLLKRFGDLIAEGKLVWPKDLSTIRAASSYAFQFEALKSLTCLMYNDVRNKEIGVVRITRLVDKARKRYWHPEKRNYHLYTGSSQHKKCGQTKHGYYEFFLGYCESEFHRGLVYYSYFEVSKDLQGKLFGTNTKDELDPQFKMNPRFFMGAKSKERTGWNLRQLAKKD